jgi:CRP-like cAMP-binding protein
MLEVFLMKDTAHQKVHMQLLPRQQLEVSLAGHVWKVQSGALRIDTAKAGQAQDFVRMALPGDVLGVEWLLDSPGQYQIHAVTPTRLVLQPIAPEELPNVVLQAFAMANRRCQEALSLRTGTVAERVKRLLLMLARHQRGSARGEVDCDLPSLSEMAEITDSAKETISRVIGSMRRLDGVHARRPMGARFSRKELSGMSLVPGMSSSTPHLGLGTVGA